MTRNLLLVSLDTLRADVAYSGRFAGLERLSRESTRFRRVVSSAPLTPPSHASVFTGLQPARHGVRHLLRERLDPDAPTLAERLAARGYATAAVVSCPGMNAWYGLGRGFAHYDDEIPRLPDGRDALQLADVKLRGRAMKRAETVTDRALAWLDARPAGPWCLFAHYFDTHWPYEAPDGGAGARNPYEGEVAYVDRHLRRLFDGLAARGVALDETLVVVFSDHGEDLAGWYADDHAGAQGHPEEEGHGCLLFDVTQLVPLWLRLPGVFPAGREIDAQVRLVDVAPTVLEALGLPAAPALDGRSLLPLVRGEERAHRHAYCETFFREELARDNPAFHGLRPLRGVRLDDRYKVVWEVGGERVEVYDLAADPSERAPLVLAGATPSGAPPSVAEPLDAAALARLRANLAAQPALAAACERLLGLLAQRPGVGLGASGSLAAGGVDVYSDLDLVVSFGERGPGPADRRWAARAVEALGRTLTSFPATHLGLPHLLIFFLELDGQIVKIDLDLEDAAALRAERFGGLVLRAPARHVAAAPDDTAPAAIEACLGDESVDRERKLAGWIWYTYTKIARGERFEGHDSLGIMRQRALLPALQDLHGLPPEGGRRLEQRLPAADLARLRDTLPRGVERDELLRALRATAAFFGEVEARRVARLGRDHRSADAAAILAAVERCEAAPAGGRA
jgi:arylsulfatase A-like enzyme